MAHVLAHFRHTVWDSFQQNPTFIPTSCLALRQHLQMKSMSCGVNTGAAEHTCVQSPHPIQNLSATMIQWDIFGMSFGRQRSLLVLGGVVRSWGLAGLWEWLFGKNKGKEQKQKPGRTKIYRKNNETKQMCQTFIGPQSRY